MCGIPANQPPSQARQQSSEGRRGPVLTLQLFEASFQDVGVLHLINKRCRGQAGLPLPVVPVHGHLSQSFPNCPYQYSTLIENEWLFCCIAEEATTEKRIKEVWKLCRMKKYLLWCLRLREKGCSVRRSSLTMCVLPTSVNESTALTVLGLFFVSASLQNTRKPHTERAREKKSGFSFHLLP